MSNILKFSGATIGVVLFIGSFTSSAHAIECNGNYQVQYSGKQIVTPYCQDNNLGYVARQAGIRVSNFEIRENPSRKEEVCQVVGHDNRVNETCAPYLNGDFRSRR